MKHPKNYKQYNKIMRKYFMRNWKKHRDPFYLNIWLEYDIKTIEQAQEVLRCTKSCSSTMRSIMEKFVQHKDSIVYSKDDRDFYFYRGVQVTNEDIYYILEDIDGKTVYNTCIGWLIPMSDQEIQDTLNSVPETEDFKKAQEHLKILIEKQKTHN